MFGVFLDVLAEFFQTLAEFRQLAHGTVEAVAEGNHVGERFLVEFDASVLLREEEGVHGALGEFE